MRTNGSFTSILEMESKMNLFMFIIVIGFCFMFCGLICVISDIRYEISNGLRDINKTLEYINEAIRKKENRR